MMLQGTATPVLLAVLVAMLAVLAVAVLLAVLAVVPVLAVVERRMQPRQLSPITERTNTYDGTTHSTRTTRQEQDNKKESKDGYRTECATTETVGL